MVPLTTEVNAHKLVLTPMALTEDKSSILPLA